MTDIRHYLTNQMQMAVSDYRCATDSDELEQATSSMARILATAAAVVGYKCADELEELYIKPLKKG